MAEDEKDQKASETESSSEATTDSIVSAEDSVAGAGSDAPAESEGSAGARRPRARKVKAAKKSVPLTPEERQAARDALRARKAVARRGERARERARHHAVEHELLATPPREHGAGTQKTRQGVVVSDKADKTITVRLDVARRHRRYEKIVRTSTTVHAHDERNDAHIGDIVVVRESRPLSRIKRWRLVEVVERAR